MTPEDLALQKIRKAAIRNSLKLDLSNNQLKNLPPEIGQLTNLTWLYLNGNRLKNLPSEIGQLSNLTLLDLSNNQLSHLPSEIGQLSNLGELYLSNNKLRRLPPEIGQFIHLTWLYLNDNQLHTLPSEIGQLTSLQRLVLNENLLPIPPEIVRRSSNPQAIITYYLENQTTTMPLNEAKVLLVGYGGAGKTSLLKRILGLPFDPYEKSTHGIHITNYPFIVNDQSITAKVWDFGGQQIMHTTHQFFLSKRSLYVLVLDGRRDENEDYWLQHIESFGGNSPVLVVLNKIDTNPSYDLNRKFLRQKYPNILGFYSLSCATDEGLETFTNALQQTIAKLDLLQTLWPKSWFQVKSALQAANEPYISYDRFIKICAEEAAMQPNSSQNILISFLHDLGIVLHFPDLDLQDTQVLEPTWVTQAVYKIINSSQLAEAKGMLQASWLRTILQPKEAGDYHYPANKHRYIIQLMLKFELCYQLAPNLWLVPDLLGVEEPDFLFDLANALHFRLDYDFLPPSVIPRFIVRLHNDIKDALRWRTGVVLENTLFTATAIVRADKDARKIDIYVSGSQRSDYLAIILHTFRSINNSFEKLDVAENVPLPSNPTVAVSYQHLIRMKRAGQTSYWPDGAMEPIDILELLERFEPSKAGNPRSDLRQIMTQSFNDNDLRDLCFEIRPNYDALDGNNTEAKIRELILYHERKGTISRLRATVRKLRPHLFG
ncbi:MAG: COR domain-containing protein [Chloroflexota bacterium]